MAFYYVKSGGTAGNTNAGRATTARTGTWNASTGDYYDNIDEVFSISAGTGTDPTTGDSIYVSSAHSHTYSADVNYATALTAGIEGLLIISVDNANQDQYLAGASESTGGTAGQYDMTLPGAGTIIGVNLTASDNVLPAARHTILEDLTITNNAQGANRINAASHSLLDIRNCTVLVENTIFDIDNGGIIRVYNSTFTPATSPNTSTNALIDTGAFQIDGGRLELYGCDLTAYSGTLIDASGVFDAGVEHSHIWLDACDIHASATYFSGYPAEHFGSIKITRTSSNSAAAEHQFLFVNCWGDVEDSTSTYRDQSVAWPSGNKSCLVIDTATAADCDVAHPFVFEPPARFADLSSTATDTYTFYISSNTSLTDANFWIEATTPDGTNLNEFELTSSRATDPLNGTALTTDTGSSWTSGGSNLYRIEITPTTGGAGVARFKVCVGVQATIYLDTQVDLS